LNYLIKVTQGILDKKNFEDGKLSVDKENWGINLVNYLYGVEKKREYSMSTFSDDERSWIKHELSRIPNTDVRSGIKEKYFLKAHVSWMVKELRFIKCIEKEKEYLALCDADYYLMKTY